MKTQVTYTHRTHLFTHLFVASLALGLSSLLVIDMVRNYHFTKGRSNKAMLETTYSLPVMHVALPEVEIIGHAPAKIHFEQQLPIENWMANPAGFATESSIEPTIELKDWMYDFNLPVQEEVQAPLQSWMF